MENVLIVAAHPDDEVLGCGGTMAKLSRQGNSVWTLILGEGVTSRDQKRKTTKRKKELVRLKLQAKKANSILGVKGVFFCDFPDNRFDTIPILDIIKAIEGIKNRLKPDIIFTHYYNDLNIDHQIAYKAVITAARPLKGETVKQIYSFEILSSTEWNYPFIFQADSFFDILPEMGQKLRALECYNSELKKFPHPRSLECVQLNAKLWGSKSGLEYAEAFRCVRVIR